MRPLFRFITGLCSLCLLTTGCSAPQYIDSVHFPDDRWAGEQSAVFEFTPTDTVGTDHRIELFVRHRSDFPDPELALEIKGVNGRKEFWTDTVILPLTDSRSGHWLGKAYSNHYDLRQLYRTNINYQTLQPRAISIRQINTRDTLSGIATIGITASGATR